MEAVKLSIVIPAYNVEKYIVRCLDSISKQTFSDFEVVIVDDGSTDKTYDLVKEYCLKDKRFSHYHKENGGQMSAYLLGLKHISGEYIGFVDPDDTIEPTMYEIMLTEISQNDCDICVCNFRRFDCNTNEFISESITDHKVISKEEINDFYRKVLPSPISEGVSMSRVNKVFKRSIILDNVKYCEMDISRVMEDRRLVPACLWSCERIVFCGLPLYNVYFNRAGSTSGKYIPNLLEIIHTIHSIHETELKDKGIFELCKKQYESSLIDFARIFLRRNVLNISDHSKKIYHCKALVKDSDIRNEIRKYQGACDKTLLCLKVAMTLKSGFLLYVLSLFNKNRTWNI